MELWLSGPLYVSVTVDYNDDFCGFFFFILIWLFFLFIFSYLSTEKLFLSLSLSLSLTHTHPLFAKEDTKEEPKEI